MCKHILLITLIIALSLTLSFPSYPYQSDVQDISQDKYYKSALSAINSAKESIFMVMYYLSFNPFNKDSKPYKLIQALIFAHRRGVKVKVILDQTLDIPSKDDEAIENWQLLKAKNIYVYELLQREGIDVSFDEPSVNTHSKVVMTPRRLTQPSLSSLFAMAKPLSKERVPTPRVSTRKMTPKQLKPYFNS